MRSIRFGMVMLFVGLGIAACADAPTAPKGAVISNGRASPSSDYVLDPVIVVGQPRCDPWLDLNWCEGEGGGECMTAVPGEAADPEYIGVSSCDASGGGLDGDGKIDGGGGASPSPECPNWDPACSNPEPEPDTCVTNNLVIDDPVVEGAFAELWANSNPDARQSARIEQAAWIVQTPSGLGIVEWTNADFGPCTIHPHMGSFAIPSDAIGWIHTHPFTNGELQTSCEPISTGPNGEPVYGDYSSFPNSDDVELAWWINDSLGRNIEAYTIDKDRIVRFVATSPTTASGYSPHGRCGY